MTSRCTPCFNKKTSLVFVHSLICKCRPIFKILSLADLPENSPCTSYRNVRLTFTTLLPFVKFGADILSTPLSSRTGLRHMEHDAGLYFALSVAALCWQCGVKDSARLHLQEPDHGRGKTAAARRGVVLLDHRVIDRYNQRMAQKTAILRCNWLVEVRTCSLNFIHIF